MKRFLKNQIDYRINGSIAQKTRNKRMEIFNDYFENVFIDGKKNISRKIKILDIGGTPDFWRYLNFNYMNSVSITSLNLDVIGVSDDLKEIITSVKGTAINMSEFMDQSFDLAFSNSVIEHVGDYINQTKMADEMRRVAAHGFLQTPNKYFFIEPHFLFPFFQFFPMKIKEKLIYRYKLGHYPKAETREEARRIAASVHLLSRRELNKLFPYAELIKEKWYGFTKSYIMKW